MSVALTEKLDSRKWTTSESASVEMVYSRTGITVGELTGISKKGWEYLWVRYADWGDTTGKTIVKKPIAAYVEKVYEDGNLAGLEIGT